MVTATQKRPVPATEVSTTTLPLCSSVAQPPPTYRSPTVENASEYEEYVERQERRQIELAEKQPDSQVHDLEAQNARLIARQQPARQPVRPVRSVGGGRVWFCHGFYISALGYLDDHPHLQLLEIAWLPGLQQRRSPGRGRANGGLCH